MFKKANSNQSTSPAPIERVTSVLGPGINWQGNLKGKGGIRIEGNFEGEIQIEGLIVIGETGRVNCKTLAAKTVIVAGALHGNILSQKLEIRNTGQVWGDVKTVAFSTEEGAFLRGKVQMEEEIDIEAVDQDDVTVDNNDE
jgi:cytoskeletal protein CcmA (bactofilin family)